MHLFCIVFIINMLSILLLHYSKNTLKKRPKFSAPRPKFTLRLVKFPLRLTKFHLRHAKRRGVIPNTHNSSPLPLGHNTLHPYHITLTPQPLILNSQFPNRPLSQSPPPSKFICTALQIQHDRLHD